MPSQGKVVVVMSEARKKKTRAKATWRLWKLFRVTMLSVILIITGPMTLQLRNKTANDDNEMLRS
jgi:hypothetical protein